MIYSTKVISVDRFFCNDYQQKSRLVSKTCRHIFAIAYLFSWSIVRSIAKGYFKRRFEDINIWWWWWRHWCNV